MQFSQNVKACLFSSSTKNGKTHSLFPHRETKLSSGIFIYKIIPPHVKNGFIKKIPIGARHTFVYNVILICEPYVSRSETHSHGDFLIRMLKKHNFMGRKNPQNECEVHLVFLEISHDDLLNSLSHVHIVYTSKRSFSFTI